MVLVSVRSLWTEYVAEFRQVDRPFPNQCTTIRPLFYKPKEFWGSIIQSPSLGSRTREHLSKFWQNFEIREHVQIARTKIAHSPRISHLIESGSSRERSWRSQAVKMQVTRIGRWKARPVMYGNSDTYLSNERHWLPTLVTKCRPVRSKTP